MNKYKSIIAFVLIFVLLFCSACTDSSKIESVPNTATEAVTEVVSDSENKIDVYAGPGEDYIKLNSITEKEIKSYLKYENNWIEIDYGAKRGYIPVETVDNIDINKIPHVVYAINSNVYPYPTIYNSKINISLFDAANVYYIPKSSGSPTNIESGKTVTILCSEKSTLYGFRRSEVLGLKWHNIDFENETIWIRETLQQSTKALTGECNYTSETKTESSNRTLPMTPQVKEVLLEQKRLQQEHKNLLDGAYYLNDYVCTFDNGKEITPNYLSRTFHKIIKKTNLPMIRFHDLRHSVASNLLNDGFTTVQVAEWLGHSSSTTTLKFYAHIDKTSKMAIANSLARV